MVLIFHQLKKTIRMTIVMCKPGGTTLRVYRVCILVEAVIFENLLGPEKFLLKIAFRHHWTISCLLKVSHKVRVISNDVLCWTWYRRRVLIVVRALFALCVCLQLDSRLYTNITWEAKHNYYTEIHSSPLEAHWPFSSTKLRQLVY